MRLRRTGWTPSDAAHTRRRPRTTPKRIGQRTVAWNWSSGKRRRPAPDHFLLYVDQVARGRVAVNECVALISASDEVVAARRPVRNDHSQQVESRADHGGAGHRCLVESDEAYGLRGQGAE